MRLFIILLLAVILLVAAFSLAQDADDTDPYLWLEEVEGEEALAWVEERSAADTAELEALAVFDDFQAQLLEIYNSTDRIPYPGVRGDYAYNFWQDAEHVRGIWRRTSLESYLSEDTEWETVIDLDALAEAEEENWVWKGARGLYPDYQRFLVTLSRGGGDASVTREFDVTTMEFLPDGFFVPEAKAQVSWMDKDTVWIGTDFGEGSLTESGYPRLVKLWKRGTALADAKLVYEGSVQDVSANGYSMHTPEGRYDFVVQTPEFFRGTTYVLRDKELVKLQIPEDADMQGVFKGQLLVSLRSPWDVGGVEYPADALITIGFEDFLNGGRKFHQLFQPEERVSLGRVANTRDHLLVSTMDNVRSKLYKYTFSGQGWTFEEVELPGLGSAGVSGTSDFSNDFFLTYTDFLTPSSLFFVPEGDPARLVKSTPEFFDATGMTVDQYEAESADGTMIPYFIVMPQGFEANGANPTMLYGYGGFEVSMRPSYSGAIGSSWVEPGGVYVLANIRGGGEFGPKWHQGAVQENHQNNFDDFIAVAEDLIARNITSPEHLGIVGGSQGGLLVGGCFVQRPDLFEAVVCQVPLLDMKRYNKLLAGASWMAEYGDPDTDDWDYMKLWSPYQNLDPNVDYPKVLFYTSTRDDRVHPGHARKMVKKMTDMGKPVYYYENTEGGHAAAANQNQRAYMWALTYAYLWMMLE